MNVFTSFIIAFAMYSRIPMVKINWTKDRMKYALAFFPLIGAVIGVLEVGWFYACEALRINNIFYAAIAVAIPIIVTGGIHMDGYCDTVDAISSMQPMEKKIEILKDSNAGAFAVIWTGVYLIVYFGAMTMVNSSEMVMCIAAGYVLSRALSAMAVIYFKCANKKGSLAAFSTAASKIAVTVVLVMFVVAVYVYECAINVYVGVALLVVSLCLFGYYYFKSKKEFGGITGDLAGWFTVKCELVVVLVVVATNVLIKVM